MRGPLPSTREIYKNALNVAWPSAAESVLVSLVGSIDTMMVGGLGPVAIAAVSLTNQPKFVLLALIMSLNVGVTTVVARRKGQQNQEGAQKCLRVALMISFGLALILSTLGYLFAEPIMQFSGAQPEASLSVGIRHTQKRLLRGSHDRRKDHDRQRHGTSQDGVRPAQCHGK